MIGSDVVVAWVEKDTGKGFAVDYYLSDKAQCSGGLGVCPKVNIEVKYWVIHASQILYKLINDFIKSKHRTVQTQFVY